MAMFSLKDLSVAWPFIKELLLGESDLATTIRRNKVATFFFFANIVLFVGLMFMSEQAFDQHGKNLATKAENDKLRGVIRSIVPPDYKGEVTADYVTRRVAELQQQTLYYKNLLQEEQQKRSTDTAPAPVVVKAAPKHVPRSKPTVNTSLKDKLSELREEG